MMMIQGAMMSFILSVPCFFIITL